MRRINRSCHKEYIEWARECTANQVYPMSIATGTQDGEIYTGGDCVLFWHYSGFAYISGNVRPDILDEIYRKFLASDTERRSETLDTENGFELLNAKRRFLLITDSEFILDYYSGADLIQIDKRIEYIYGGIPENIPILDESFALETITADNIGEIRGRITPSFSWKDSDSFLQNGFGFIARSKEDGCFAAVAFSSAISPEEVDIGVETTVEYRHHGLASYLAYRMCMEIIQQGRKPVWAHAETNTGSQKTALSVGFKPIVINMVIHNKK